PAGTGPHRGDASRPQLLRLSAATVLCGCPGAMPSAALPTVQPWLRPGGRYQGVLRSNLARLAVGPRAHGPHRPGAVAESGLPGKRRLLRHHGRNPSRRDHLARAGESSLGWTGNAAGPTLRRHADAAATEPGPPGSLCG